MKRRKINTWQYNHYCDLLEAKGYRIRTYIALDGEYYYYIEVYLKRKNIGRFLTPRWAYERIMSVPF